MMTRTITQRELRNDSAAVLREVQAGATFIVSRNGTPVAELRPLGPRRFVGRTQLAVDLRRLAPLNAERFRHDIDAVIDDSFDA